MSSHDIGPGGFELVYDPRPSIWLVGPDENSPVDVWLPGATQALVADFDVHDLEVKAYIEAVLRRFAIDDSVPLTERLLRWPTLDEDPFVMFLGAVERRDWEPADLTDFLEQAGEDLVEPAMVVTIDHAASQSVRRGIGYGRGDDALVCGVRYVIDNEDPDLVSVMMTAISRPGRLIEALNDFDELARTVHVRRS